MKILLLLLLLSSCTKEHEIEVVQTNEFWECHKKPMKIILPSTLESKDYLNNIRCTKEVKNTIKIDGYPVESKYYSDGFEVLLQESRINTGYDSLPSKTTGDRYTLLNSLKDWE